jgi:serine/threonine protein kinase
MSQGNSGTPAEGGIHSTSRTEHADDDPANRAPRAAAQAGAEAGDENQTIDLCVDDLRRAIKESLPEKGPPPPIELEGYQLNACLGQGTFGEVWKGEQLTTGVQVAVKFLLRARDRVQLQSMRDETSKLAMLHSEPRIVRLIDVASDAPVPYFVMDYAEKGSLAGRLAKGPLPAAEAIAIFRQIVEAMAYVHAKGIRHCDLKPGNILLDAAGRPKVADFGQAMLSIEPTTAALGTFFYMAPEQAAGQRQVADATWDVYGMGALAYAMLTGEPPRFDKGLRRDLEQTVQLSHRLDRYRKWVESCPPPSKHRTVKGVDRDLADIIDRCLAIDPAQRLRDAGDVLAALERRDARRRSRPLMLFAIFAPLLLLTAFLVVGLYAVRQTHLAVEHANTALADQKGQVDQVAAELVADLVREKLDNVRDQVTLLSRSDNLRKLYLALLSAQGDKGAVPAKQREKRLYELEQQFKRMGEFEGEIDFIGVCDRDSALVAGWVRTSNPKNAFPRELYGKLQSNRDFWNHSGDRFSKTPPEPVAYSHYTEKDGKGNDVEVAYIGQPFASASPGTKPFAAISVSMPIYRDPQAPVKDKEMIGLLVAAVKLATLNNWMGRLEQEEGCVVLLDRNGYCVHHRKDLRSKYEPIPGENPKRLTDVAPAFKRVLAGERDVDPEHLDPFDGRTYIATFEPVEPYGWGVIVQYDPKKDRVRHELRQANAGITGLLWGGLLPGALLIVAFWGLLVWTLRRRETVVHG